MLSASIPGTKTTRKFQRNLLYLPWNVHNNNSSIAFDSSKWKFDFDGQKIFVNSIVIYFANIALMSIAYGYKIHIMLFQKHRNTKEAFQKSMREAMQKCLNETTL